MLPAMSTGNPALDRAREIVRAAHTLGPSPSLLRIEEQLRSGDANARQLARLIEGSPALAARVLRMANSAFYAPLEPVVSLNRAVAMLGDTVLRQLVLTSLVMARGAGRRNARQALAAARLTADAVRSAVVARSLAMATKAVVADEAFAAGLLHDLGHVYLLDAVGDAYAEYLLAAGTTIGDMEREMELAATSHQEVGAVFAYEWNLPSAVAAVLWEHHAPAARTLIGIVAGSDVLIADFASHRPEAADESRADADAALVAVGLTREAWEAMLPKVRADISELMTVFELTEG
jgi:HD-like signal output (HDOD) protein